MMSCPKKNECPEQECPVFMICGTNRQLFGSSFFEQFKADPYVQSLYKRFQVNSSSDLASQVERLLKQKRLAY